jgi:hypothetical protein
MIEFFSHGSKLPTFELGDLDRAPSFGGSDERTEHQFQHGPLAECIRDDFETTAFLDKQAFK